jgi:cytochrome c oxidase subunit I+III
MDFENNAGNVWNAGTLEWLPSGNYGLRSIPIVTSREPLWDQPNLARDVEAGHYYLPNAPTGNRETIVSSPRDGTPQFLLRMPPTGWSPFVASVFTAAFFLLLTGKFVIPAVACGAIAIGALARWAWDLDPAPLAHPVDIGGGIELPAYMSGPRSQSWSAVVVLMLVAGSLYGCVVFSYLYLWTVAPDFWPSASALPGLEYPLLASGLLLASSSCVGLANRSLGAHRRGLMIASMAAGFALLAAALGVEIAAHRALSPTASGYGAIVYLIVSFAGFYTTVIFAMAAFTIVRAAHGLVDPVRRVTFDNARLLWHYTVGQTLAGVVLVHGFPRLAG